MYSIQVSERTFSTLQVAARVTGMSPGAIVDRLVMESERAPAVEVLPEDDSDGVAVYCDYNGERFQGVFHQKTRRINITTGRLTGSKFKSPSAAARAVVASEKPEVNSNRNGWRFWILDDGSGRLLETIRDSV